ncbi:hypothetical protein [Paenibacillus sp. PAMC21692]|uniref:hypothetical protein n=1 Tax=Paenibacillus sp. PAMC21692 TaxID=2762320 RepID=UPI00164D36A6|nr:hypothetical protein [Paenibacillus sp. PAMC21692]QNK57610.1 hypothetical protein H7F31_01100 [Paenibacillus sp. PAMC21692]
MNLHEGVDAGMAEENERAHGRRKSGIDGKGQDRFGPHGVGHNGLVTERDIDAEFGLFQDEVPLPKHRKQSREEM